MGKDLTKADYKIVNQAANQISKYKSRYSDEAVLEDLMFLIYEMTKLSSFLELRLRVLLREMACDDKIEIEDISSYTMMQLILTIQAIDIQRTKNFIKPEGYTELINVAHRRNEIIHGYFPKIYEADGTLIDSFIPGTCQMLWQLNNELNMIIKQIDSHTKLGDAIEKYKKDLGRE